MRPYLSRASVLAWFLALAAACILAACGGGQAPILGTGSGVSLPPAVSATVPVAQNPPVTGVAINTRITATFTKAMNPATYTYILNFRTIDGRSGSRKGNVTLFR